jgi:hypothetical protein
MALTINAVTEIGNRAVLQVLSRLWDVGPSLPFDRTYVPANSYGERFLYPGMIVGRNCDQSKYVPYSTGGASYGAYSSYAVGIIYILYDFTYEEQIVAPATRAAAIEAHCYVYGSGTLGSIPDAVKTATGMKLIQWD